MCVTQKTLVFRAGLAAEIELMVVILSYSPSVMISWPLVM